MKLMKLSKPDKVCEYCKEVYIMKGDGWRCDCLYNSISNKKISHGTIPCLQQSWFYTHCSLHKEQKKKEKIEVLEAIEKI